MLLDSSGSSDIFQQIIGSWHDSLRDPEKAQSETLRELLKGYAKTDYGRTRGASQIDGYQDFKTNFRKIDYPHLNSYLAEVQKGNYQTILSEPLVCWVMTRGSTGKAKVLPATKTHLEEIFTCGARAIVNWALRKNDAELLTGNILNLNFPSNVHSITEDGRVATYGYSSGTYARLNPMLDKVSLLPRQEEIDGLGPGITKTDWERRFELAYERTRSANITSAMGVTPMILAFATYVQKKHHKRPKDFWNLHALFCTSVRKIPFKYGPILRKYFGQIDIVEIYSATEGVFAQQLDELPYVVPNYDHYFLEVETPRETKMLHELKRGEWGKLIVSSCMYPRYDIGDLVEAAGKDHFRVVGRVNALTLLEHRLYRLLLGWLA